MSSNVLPTPSVPCLRVTQLDAQDLDNYLVELLVRNQLDKCLKFLLPNYTARIKPELQTGVYALLMCSTVGKLHQTVGQKLFGIMLAESPDLRLTSKRKIWILIGLEVFLYWWKARYSDVHPTFVSSRPNLTMSLNFVISITKLLELFNFLMFLRSGRFNRLLLRLLGFRIAFDHPNPVPSSISYTILSREILWKGFAEASMYFLSLFDVPRLRKYAFRILDSSAERDGKSSLHKCGICEESLTQPYEADCGHSFCYYCASTAIATQSRCPFCDTTVKGLRGPQTNNNSAETS